MKLAVHMHWVELLRTRRSLLFFLVVVRSLTSLAPPGTCDAAAPGLPKTSELVNRSMHSETPDSQLTVERIFSRDEFQEETVGPIVWSKLGGAYFTLKKSEAESAGQSLVRINEGNNTVPHFYSLLTDYLSTHLTPQKPE